MDKYKIIATSEDGKTLVIQYEKTGVIEIRKINDSCIMEKTKINDDVDFSMEKYF